MTMRKLFPVVMTSGAILLSACGRAEMPSTAYRSLPTMVSTQGVAKAPVQLLVRFNKNVSRTALQAFNQKYQLQTVNYLPQIDAYVMSPKAAISSQAALQALVGSMKKEAVAALVEVNAEIQVAPVHPEMSISPIFNR